jgi:hypothetical protein
MTAGQLARPPMSPIRALRARIADELTAGTITVQCPHPDALARHLWLPLNLLLCHRCVLELVQQNALPDTELGTCGACGATDASRWTGWLHQQPITGVRVRICAACASAENALRTCN